MMHLTGELLIVGCCVIARAAAWCIHGLSGNAPPVLCRRPLVGPTGCRGHRLLQNFEVLFIVIVALVPVTIHGR